MAIAVGILVPRDHSTEIEVEQVVERFRASTSPATTESAATATGADTTGTPSSTAAPAPAPGPATATTAATSDAIPSSTEPAPLPVALVEPGVYVYRTTGFEQVDAFAGVTHDYPAETTITVIADGCGVLLRWDALEERREEWRLCTRTAGIELQPQALQYHEFFDQETPEDVICDVPVLLVPVADGPIEPVAQTCTLDTDPWLPVWEVLETDVREVGGRSVDVRHVRMTIDDTDRHFEHYVADWLLAPNGLPVELNVMKQSKSPTVVGDVVYDEQLRLDLVSLDPLR